MKITFLETSDLHGYIYPTDYSNKKDLPLGAAKAFAKLKEQREQADGPVIMIENGDFIQGSPLSYYLAKEHNTSQELSNLINLMDYDVQIIGNHEFNYGMDYLNEFINHCHAPILAANILNEKGQPYFGKAYEIIEKQGIEIAILGLTTQYVPHWENPETLKGLTFESVVETAKKYIPILKQQADIIVVSYHGGFEKDLATGNATEALTGENEGYQLLQEVDGIDALFTGHQHRIIATKVNGIPVVQPGYRGSHIGEIQLTVEKTNNTVTITESSARIHSLDKVEADSQIISAIEPAESALEDWLDQQLGTVEGDMRIIDPMQARLKEHPYIEFIHHVQQFASGVKISGTALFNNEGKGFDQSITMRDIITNYIYPNTLAVIKITGKELRAALEQTANYLAVQDGEIIFNPDYIHPKPQYYNYDMYEGIDYTIDMKQPSGQRITELLFENQPITDDQELEVVTNHYRAIGGGNYHMFHVDKIIKEIQVDMTELIADYLKKHPVIKAEVDHNFRVVL
ncbi:bifunctional metallophosphatase/5'-nucleotidase [Vagococcus xieshaowenii]|uniref:Bifunctional metallophosphatase/5'-nucleotidase n=1 Tax=Vagococcus xieshaowenii TaxID=2562451 RepID=A0AAJ5EDB0_9ENTE|nr:bifunctional UDP-sugar hydrolase/5'-nucleotidase [Vagococcus xieshaowenii]QCA27908.1 bifunctional metallophosphatase/5'-nucleotidase [Vagococcus xieshaowenii]TFZ39413.1 bifunctional metallophosphatase/5'-nucleotidase [Vagococcus xieshaowenii]